MEAVRRESGNYPMKVVVGIGELTCNGNHHDLNESQIYRKKRINTDISNHTRTTELFFHAEAIMNRYKSLQRNKFKFEQE